MSREERGLLARVFLSALLLYGLFTWPFEGEVPLRYVDLTRAIVEDGGLCIDRWHENTSDKALVDGHYYAAAAPGPALLGVVPWALVRGLGGSVLLAQALVTFLVGPLAGALAVAAFFRLTGLAGSLPLADRLWATAALGLGTFMFPLATVLYPHALTLALGTGAAVAILLHAREQATRTALAAGALAGALPLCEYQAAVLLLALGAWLVLEAGPEPRARARALGSFAAGAAGPLLILAAYHTACFGAPWRTGYGAHADATIRTIQASGAGGFQLPTARTLWEVSFGAARGLFPFAPPLLVALALGLRAPAGERARPALGLGVGLLCLLLHAARLNDWYGGFSWGPRYQAAALPFWLLPLLSANRPAWARRALAASTALGALLSLVGAGTRWAQTLDAALAEAAAFGLQAKGLGPLLGAGPGYYPAGVERLGPQLVAWTTLGLVLWAGALWLLWRPGPGPRRVCAALLVLLVTSQALAVSYSWRRQEALRRTLHAQEYISFVWHFDAPENFVTAADVALLELGDRALAAALAERALELAPGTEQAQLRLALARDDEQALARLAREARDPGVRARARSRR